MFALFQADLPIGKKLWIALLAIVIGGSIALVFLLIDIENGNCRVNYRKATRINSASGYSVSWDTVTHILEKEQKNVIRGIIEITGMIDDYQLQEPYLHNFTIALDGEKVGAKVHRGELPDLEDGAS